MTHFVCLSYTGTGQPDSFDELASGLARATGQVATEIRLPGFSAAVWSDSTAIGYYATETFVVVGKVRLECREQFLRSCHVDVPGSLALTSDLQIIVRGFAALGEASFSHLSGDYAFALWDCRSRKLHVVRDWIGVRRAFVKEGYRSLAVSSDASLLGNAGAYSDEYVADFLSSTAAPDPDSTIWRGVRGVQPGTCLTFEGGASTTSTFQSLWHVQPSRYVPATEAVQHFRALFDEAVDSCVDPDGSTWAQLSGGHDSSSIVVTAQRPCNNDRKRLGGTYSFVDDIARYGEEHFADEVVKTTSVHNVKLRNYFAWQEDGELPPVTDEPRYHYVFWARDRAARALVRSNGGRVVLGGDGSDHYLGGNPRRIADLLLQGHPRLALREAHSRSLAGGSSVWFQLSAKGIVPAARSLRWRRNPPSQAFDIPIWLSRHFRHHVESRSASRRDTIHREIGIHGSRIRAILHSIRSILEVQPIRDEVEKRYPFLNRQLLEYYLSLAVTVEAGHGESKWILREAMGDRLPTGVRTRTRKSSAESRLLWALDHKYDRLRGLLRDPLVVQAGWVERDMLHQSVAHARAGIAKGIRSLLAVLSLETWLAVTSGQWQRSAPDKLPLAESETT